MRQSKAMLTQGRISVAFGVVGPVMRAGVDELRLRLAWARRRTAARREMRRLTPWLRADIGLATEPGRAGEAAHARRHAEREHRDG